MAVRAGLKHPSKSPLRHAADAVFHLKAAERSAAEAEAGAGNERGREIARRMRAAARVLRTQHAAELEKELTR